MAAGQFRTELPTMSQASAHVEQVNQQIQAQLRQLWSQLQPLSGSWQGSAATGFTTLHERWQTDAAKLNAALQGISTALAKSQSNYAQSEDTNTSGFSRISAAL